MSYEAPNVSKALPHNIEAEQAILGAVFINNAAYDAVSNFLKPEHFFEKLHATLWASIGSLISTGKKANPVTLKPFIPADDKVSDDMTVFQYAVRLATEAVTVVNAVDYAHCIVDLFQDRQLISISLDAMDQAYNPSPDKSAADIAAEIEEKLAVLRSESPKAEGPGTAKASVERMLEEEKSGAVSPSIEMPLPQITEVLNGSLEVTNYYGLLSSSGEGKTSLVLQIVDHVARNGHPVLFLSYDQSAEQIFRQIASQRTGIEVPRIRQKLLTDKEKERYYTALLEISRLRIEVKKCKTEGVAQLGGYVRQFRKRFPDGYPMIFLDHVRKVAPRDPRAHEGRIASEVNGFCKAMAEEINGVWFSLIQRSSVGLKRDNPRPISADVFGGEQAKEDFDGLLYLYRPDKYKEDQLRIAKNDKEKDEIERRFDGWRDQAEIGALKVRFGDSTIRRRLRFEKECTRYVSMRQETDATFEGMGF
ncbi:helicase DnaB [Brucella intermedia GD04153]|uniref:DNA 5'-3' helicase n=1 Tax=Brucella intermedia GD04153 TaxID=2975438 RepID=A0AA42KQM7_9HYPH|nr:DnaB-like helicase C-terminal domain-containing protein [Brucella intermedia]MDH0126656.1 helicase DnaB [Brucella intermedia GD04153]